MTKKPKTKITVTRDGKLPHAEIEVELTLRGDVAEVIQVMATGLPRAVLMEFRDALNTELQKPRL